MYVIHISGNQLWNLLMKVISFIHKYLILQLMSIHLAINSIIHILPNFFYSDIYSLF